MVTTTLLSEGFLHHGHPFPSQPCFQGLAPKWLSGGVAPDPKSNLFLHFLDRHKDEKIGHDKAERARSYVKGNS
jgi:hypothetical protein